MKKQKVKYNLLKIRKPKSISFLLKVSVILLCISYINISTASNYAQNTKLSLSLKDVSIKQALKKIEQQSDFYFMYNDTKVDVNRKISFDVQGSDIYEVLDLIFANSEIVYEVVDKQIVLNPKSNKNANHSLEIKEIKGKVIDETGSPLPGVNVFVYGTTIGTVTDINGNYAIDVPSEDVVLVFSFVGFSPQEVTVGNQTEINITLYEEATKLDEIVVIGYGTSSKKLLTSSVASIKSDEIQETISGNVQSTLQGKTSGVQIVQNSGTPGGAVSMKIRGASSLFSGTEPLYIVDGVPVIKGDFGQIGFEGQGIDAISDINPNDIESISILKDASAASIYGSRAANGVVMITTKKGKSGESKISLRTYTGYQKEWKRLDMMNAQEWKDYVSTFDPDFVASLDPTIDTDWQNEVFRTAPISSYELSFVGGDEKTQLFVSGGYFDQQGIVIGSEYEKYSGRINVDHKLTKKLSVSARVGTNYSINNRVVGDQTINGVLPNAISKPPIYAVRDSVGNYLEEGFWDNPVAIGNEVTNEAKTLRNISSLDIKYEIINGLSLSNQLGIDFYNLHERRYEPTTVDRGRESNGIGIDARSEVRSLSNQTTLDYIKTFNDVHDFTFLLGTSVESENRSYSWIRASNFPSDDLEYITSAGNIEEATAIEYNDGLTSIFGRIKYNFQNRYIVELSYRRDGSSKFGENNKYANLPAIAFAWRLNEEGFIKKLNFFNELKLKIGYGLTGNDQIPSNRHQNLYISGRNYYGQPGIAPSQIPNPDLKWETSNNLNIGLDISVFNGRVDLSGEYYYNQTKDLLMARPISGSSGYSSYMANVGSVINSGYEFTLSTLNINGQLKWNTDFNIAFNKNKITDLYNGQPFLDQGRGQNAAIEGEPIGVFYMYKSLGVNPSNGELVFDDFNNDGKITDEDRQIVGDPNPLFIGGITNILSFKNFDLRFFFQFSYGNDIFNGTRQYAESMKYGTSDNQLATIQDRWQQPGDITYIPRDDGENNLFPISSHYIEDGSYLRLKELTFGYNFSSKLLAKINFITSARIYLKAQNILTFTNYSGLDPEVNYSGVSNIVQGTDFFTYPIAKAYIIGINLDF